MIYEDLSKFNLADLLRTRAFLAPQVVRRSSWQTYRTLVSATACGIDCVIPLAVSFLGGTFRNLLRYAKFAQGIIKARFVLASKLQGVHTFLDCDHTGFHQKLAAQ